MGKRGIVQRSRGLLKQSIIQLRDRWKWRRFHSTILAQPAAEIAEHLQAGMDWLTRAQDAGSDRGVAYGAELEGPLLASYPETTGYIIPTFLDVARWRGDPSYRWRAIEMGDWEISIQMSDGAVMGGRVDSPAAPAVFNTGQVLLGWAALVRETAEPRFLEAARRASAWLIAMQEPNGDWQRGNSAFANAHSTVYNVKAAWGLCAAGLAGVGEPAVAAAIRNAEYSLTRQNSRGWFANCCLTDPLHPLLHTLGYTMQGLLGIAHLTGRHDFARAAEKCARALLATQGPDGFLPGRFDENFQGTVPWACLTGIAQTSIVWSELFALTGDPAFRDARNRANRYLMARHDLRNPNPILRGAVFGSWPVWGGYRRLRVINWGVKFLVDALLLELQQEGRSDGRPAPSGPAQLA